MKSETPAASERFAWALDAVFGGSQSLMAGALGCSQSIISRIVRGRQQPGPKLVLALAAHPAVNSLWATTGEGPALASQATEYDGQAALPVASRLFAGLPYDHPDCLAPELLPVERRLHRRSRYWVRASATPYPADPDVPVIDSDRLLFEADPEAWPRQGAGSLCILMIRDEGPENLSFARRLSGNARTGRASQFLIGATVDFEKFEYHGRPLRNVRVENTEMEAPAADRSVQVVALAIHRSGDL